MKCDQQYRQDLALHLKEVKERNVINSIAEIWRMLEEEHAGESGVDDVGMTA